MTILWVWWLLSSTFSAPGPEVFYRSPSLASIELQKIDREERIQDDEGFPVVVTPYVDHYGLRYWYRRIFTGVCLTGECKPVDIGIFWLATGRYAGLEVYQEELTKTDHSNFTNEDYARLEEILQDEWSDLREYTLEELVDTPATSHSGETDAVTGATKLNVSKSAVKDAVYSTHTIWHLIHVGEPEQLTLLTLSEMREDPSIAHALLASDSIDNRKIVFDGVIHGYLFPDSVIEMAVLEGVLLDDMAMRNLAFRALNILDFSKINLQQALADIFPKIAPNEKARLLAPLEQAPHLSPPLRNALVKEFTEETPPWILIGLLRLFKQKEVELTVTERNKISRIHTDYPPLKKAFTEW